jgi:hypothetical protein
MGFGAAVARDFSRVTARKGRRFAKPTGKITNSDLGADGVGNGPLGSREL